MTLAELTARWEERRDEYVRLRVQVDGGTLVAQMLGELRAAIPDRSDELLTLSHAAEACGYSADHLGRLVRDAALKNYGRKHAPRVRLGDLPRRPRRPVGLRERNRTQYDAVTDARSLRSRQRRGGTDDPAQN